jgi:RHS repeat-associated protein
LISKEQGNEELFYLSDGHSGIRQLSDQLGNVTDTYNYDAYGNLLQATGSSPNNYLYRGEQFDPNIDAQYLRARYYDPDLGRFLSADPFEGVPAMPMTRHRYIYGNDNPVTYVDPSGEFSLPELNVAQQIVASLAGALVQFQETCFARGESSLQPK